MSGAGVKLTVSRMDAERQGIAKRRQFGSSPRGIKVGDTVGKDEDINSEPVSVAARLEVLTEQG